MSRYTDITDIWLAAFIVALVALFVLGRVVP